MTFGFQAALKNKFPVKVHNTHWEPNPLQFSGLNFGILPSAGRAECNYDEQNGRGLRSEGENARPLDRKIYLATMPTDPWVGTWRPHRPRMAIAAMYGGPGPKYLLPGHTGYVGHDATSYRAPAYSLAQRLPGLKDSGTPAPKTIPEKMTHHGKETAPAWTLGHRPRDIDPGRTPGPANYKIEQANRLVHRSGPAYSMALRTIGFKENDGPGPARYNDVQVFGPKIPHLKAAPAYSISQKTAFGSMLSNIVKTPGPCAYKHVETDVFKNRAPKYTIVQRNLIPGDTTLRPGPNRYRTEDVNVHKNHPKYTFGIHHSDYLTPLIVTPTD